MSIGRNMPCEVRFHVTPEMHEWLKAAALKRGDGVAPYLRTLIAQDMERLERAGQRRSTDPLIESIHPLVEEMAGRMKAMSEKLGVELLEEDGNVYQLEDERSSEKGRQNRN